MATAPGVDLVGGNRLAGFLEAECHLGVVPNNGDGWRCFCSVALRDDDRQILEAAQERLGIGHLVGKRAINGSRPQVVWNVASKVECAALVDLLDVHPFRGRKLTEYGIWRDAVMLWAARAYGLAPGAQRRLERLAAGLKQARVYEEPATESPPDLTDRHAVHYFAGFFSGEGSFGLGPRNARFVIKLRRDDRPLLEAFRRQFRMGTVVDVTTPEPWSPAAVWHVTGARDVLRGIVLLDTGGLMGRKRRQFQAWRPGAEAVAEARIARVPVDARSVTDARRALSRATAYAPPVAPLRPDGRHRDTRTAYIDVLREWAASVDGPLSCTRYEAMREHQRHWPKRDTIAFAFGGWYEALEAAGLEGRAARRKLARQLRVQPDRLHASQGL